MNALWNIMDRGGLRIGLLGGFRFVKLDEDLVFSTNSPFLPPNVDIFQTTDRFATGNNFYGGQLGLRTEYCMGGFTVAATGKVALGDMHQVTQINGSLLTNDFIGFPGPAATYPGGYLTQPSNIGRYTQNRLAVIPEAILTVGYQVTSWARVSAGYSFLYMNNVARPADQIDRVINPSQSVTISNINTATLVGPARPIFPGGQSDFWAQGVNFGLEFTF